MSDHCQDCCCARSWKALGITEYTGKSIPEHITENLQYTKKLEEELDRYHVEEAYHRGQRDYIQNDGRKNPYRDGTESSRLWSAGFNELQIRNL